jgi:CheY-like chemotaxis protein
MNTTPHLLIVDDDSEICTLLSSFLGQYGYRVSVATNGGAMMRTLASAKIDLVVLDIMLPGRDGLALCKELRASGRLPIIMLTAIDGEADRVLGLEIGRPGRAATTHLDPRPAARSRPRPRLVAVRPRDRRSHQPAAQTDRG